MKNKTVVIIRGVSGSGKSTFAETVKAHTQGNAVICTADDYFHQNGEYRFDPTKLGKAHGYCFRKFCKAIEENKPLVIQNNTNSNPKEFQKYVDFAEEKGYIVFSIVMENRHGNSNVHGVPNETVERQYNNLITSLLLK